MKNTLDERLQTLNDETASHWEMGLPYVSVNPMTGEPVGNQRQAYAKLLRYAGQLPLDTIKTVLVVLAGCTQITDDELCVLAKKSIEGRVDSSEQVMDLLMGGYQAASASVRLIPVLTKAVHEVLGENCASVVAFQMGLLYLERSLGFGEEAAEPKIMEAQIRNAKTYTAEEFELYISQLARYWALAVQSTDLHYQYTGEDYEQRCDIPAAKKTLFMLAKAGADMNPILSEICLHDDKKWRNMVVNWLLDAGANWKAIHATDQDLEQIIAKRVRKVADRLYSISQKTNPGLKAGVASLRPKM